MTIKNTTLFSAKNLMTTIGFWLSALVSFALTVEFFRSLASSVMALVLFISIALIFELLKLQCLQQLPECFRERKAFLFIVCTTVYCFLAVLSFCASVGSMTSSILIQKTSMDRVGEHNSVLRSQMQSISNEVTQNNKSIQVYQKMQMIQLGVLPLQKQNASLRRQLQELQKQLQPIPHASAMESVVESIQSALQTSYKTATLLLFGLLALLLELACAVFVVLSNAGCISRKHLQKSTSENQRSISCICNIYDKNGISAALPANKISVLGGQVDVEDKHTAVSSQKENQKQKKKKDVEFEKLPFNKTLIIRDIRSRKGSVSKRMLLRRYEVGADKLNEIFSDLIRQEIIVQKPSGRYHVVTAA